MMGVYVELKTVKTNGVGERKWQLRQKKRENKGNEEIKWDKIKDKNKGILMKYLRGINLT